MTQKLKVKENDICRAISDWLSWHKIWFRRIHNIGLATTKGISDYWLVVDGRSIALEVKTPDTYLTQNQRVFLETHYSSGGCSWVIRSVDELQKALDNYKSICNLKTYSSNTEKDFGDVF